MSDFTQARELNKIHRKLEPFMKHPGPQTSEEVESWNTNIAAYEDLLGKKLVRSDNGDVLLPFRTEDVDW